MKTIAFNSKGSLIPIRLFAFEIKGKNIERKSETHAKGESTKIRKKGSMQKKERIKIVTKIIRKQMITDDN